MSTLSTHPVNDLPASGSAAMGPVLLVGNPNAGKTSVFNRLTGLRSKTANYPGITVDLRSSRVKLEAQTGGPEIELIDLPGLYSLTPTSPEERVAVDALSGTKLRRPAAVILVLDATNLTRNLALAGEVLELGLPTMVVLNLIDAAESQGIEIDAEKLALSLEVPVVKVSAKKNFGFKQLEGQLGRLISETQTSLPMLIQRPTCAVGCAGCKFAARHNWSEAIVSQSVLGSGKPSRASEAIDKFLTAPLVGTAALIAIMLSVFFLIFSMADIPMAAIENVFGTIAEFVAAWLPKEVISRWVWIPAVFALTFSVALGGLKLRRKEWTKRRVLFAAACGIAVAILPQNDFSSLLIDGVLGGLAGVVVFLPQICILFFFLTMLEDSGYMARAAFVMERIMRFVGLPGKAFVPMLSAHACAIPGIMATRTIESWRDRMVTIIVLPMLTCSARLPVYAMLAALLFGDNALWAGVMFAAAYSLGLGCALLTAWLLKKSILKGEAEPLVIELPPYRIPSLANAARTTMDRAGDFLRKAGSVILLISVVLWAMATYPKLPDDAAAAELSEEQQAKMAIEYSAVGRMGRALEPVFEPLGYDWQMNVAVMSSFAAREVFVSTLSVVYGMGEEDNEIGLTERLRTQESADGHRAFDRPTCISLLVFYVLAMQCLPTQAVTRRETGSWKWAGFQLLYMSVFAYGAAFVAYRIALFFA